MGSDGESVAIAPRRVRVVDMKRVLAMGSIHLFNSDGGGTCHSLLPYSRVEFSGFEILRKKGLGLCGKSHAENSGKAGDTENGSRLHGESLSAPLGMSPAEGWANSAPQRWLLLWSMR